MGEDLLCDSIQQSVVCKKLCSDRIAACFPKLNRMRALRIGSRHRKHPLFSDKYRTIIFLHSKPNRYICKILRCVQNFCADGAYFSGFTDKFICTGLIEIQSAQQGACHIKDQLRHTGQLHQLLRLQADAANA